jgi:dihydroorotate dehydrogenase
MIDPLSDESGRWRNVVVPHQMAEELRLDLSEGRIDFSHLGSPVGELSALELDHLLREADRVGDIESGLAMEIVRITILSRRSDLLAKYGLPYFAYDHLSADYWSTTAEVPTRLSHLKPGGPTDEVGTRDFLGVQIGMPIGIGSSVLTATPEAVASLGRLGFNVISYKTVRSDEWDPHDPPTWTFVDDEELPYNLDSAPRTIRTRASTMPKDLRRSSTVNSFGAPSKKPEIWTKELVAAREALDPSKVLLASVMGTYEKFQGQDFIEDCLRVVGYAAETRPHGIELNLSCPNVVDPTTNRTDGPVLCEDAFTVAQIVYEIRSRVDDSIPLVLKLGSMSRTAIDELVRSVVDIGPGAFQALSGINTMRVSVITPDDSALFSGSIANPEKRLMAGLSGAAIRSFGLQFVRYAQEIREQLGATFKIIGAGGVLDRADFAEYRSEGADVVQTVTGAFIDPLLATRLTSEELRSDRTFRGWAPAVV